MGVASTSAWRVVTYLDAHESSIPTLKKVLGPVLKHAFPKLEAEVLEHPTGLAVALRIVAVDENSARHKARYWLERATRKNKVMRWTGKTTEDALVEPWPT